jgi:hypothetical protein
MPDFVPSRDALLLAFGANYSAIITAAPTSVGLTAAIASELAGFQANYAMQLAAATEPSTRGKATVFAKNVAKADLVSFIRQTARTIQGTPTVTDEQKLALGLTIRKTHPTPVNPPSVAPAVAVASVVGRVLNLTLRDSTNGKRARPFGAFSAWVYTYVGATYPSDPSDWAFQGAATRFEHAVTFPNTVAPGAQVWVCAAWINRRGESGPPSVPITTNIQGGGVGASVDIKLAA